MRADAHPATAAASAARSALGCGPQAAEVDHCRTRPAQDHGLHRLHRRLQRTKTEIKRDFDYLARLWDDIRETTLKSTAPALIHSDSDPIKRAIRDIYNREIEKRWSRVNRAIARPAIS